VVEDVEQLGPEPKRHLLSKVKLPLQPNIGLRSSETAQDVAAKIALLTNGRCSEGRLVEDFAARILRAKELKRHSRYDIWAWIEGYAISEEQSGDNVDRGS